MVLNTRVSKGRSSTERDFFLLLSKWKDEIVLFYFRIYYLCFTWMVNLGPLFFLLHEYINWIRGTFYVLGVLVFFVFSYVSQTIDVDSCIQVKDEKMPGIFLTYTNWCDDPYEQT